MNVLHEFSQAWRDTYRLERRYYVLTSVIGLTGVAVGMGILVATAYSFARYLGIDPDAAPVTSERNGMLWIAALLIGIPISIYLGAVTVAGLFGTTMVLLGKFTKSEAVRYAFLSRYPTHWLRRDA